jgi:hypothetical protein
MEASRKEHPIIGPSARESPKGQEARDCLLADRTFRQMKQPVPKLLKRDRSATHKLYQFLGRTESRKPFKQVLTQFPDIIGTRWPV